MKFIIGTAKQKVYEIIHLYKLYLVTPYILPPLRMASINSEPKMIK